MPSPPAALIVKGLLLPRCWPVTFMTYTATVMNLGILGLDRDPYTLHEPPAGAEPRQLLAACTPDVGGVSAVLWGCVQPVAAAVALGLALTARGWCRCLFA